MKNLKSTEPTDLDEHGWYSDIYKGKKSGRDNDICTVWGKTKEELEQRVIMIRKAGEMLEALKAISELFNSQDVLIKEDHIWDEYEKLEILIKQIES